MTEVWVKLYCCDEVEVSSLGRVRRTDRRTADGRFFKSSIINPSKSNPYLRFAYTYKGKRYFESVHRAVYFSFVDIDPPRHTKYNYVVDHIDSDRANNRIDNLQLISQSKNVLKSLK